MALAAGLGVDVTDAEGRSALHYAAANGQREVVARLLKAGASRGLTDRRGSAPTSKDVQIRKLLAT